MAFDDGEERDDVRLENPEAPVRFIQGAGVGLATPQSNGSRVAGMNDIKHAGAKGSNSGGATGSNTAGAKGSSVDGAQGQAGGAGETGATFVVLEGVTVQKEALQKALYAHFGTFEKVGTLNTEH